MMRIENWPMFCAVPAASPNITHQSQQRATHFAIFHKHSKNEQKNIRSRKGYIKKTWIICKENLSETMLSYTEFIHWVTPHDGVMLQHIYHCI